MTRFIGPCVLLLVISIFLFDKVTSKMGRSSTPFEEKESNFPYQNIRAALNIRGKVFVESRNYGTSTKHRCLYTQRANMYSTTNYKFILGSTTAFKRMFLVKFSTRLELLKTGHHKHYNAVMFKQRKADSGKLVKLMYMNRKKTCFIFVNNRSSGHERPKCQLMRPARHANQPVPGDCRRVYNQNCHGEKIKLYRPWCQLLPERWYSSYKNKQKKSFSRKVE
uniref:Putative lipocal-1 1 n=1 Tax=Amblyomma triste TaxID=251400 RepID=A0A023G9Z1_AMBTT